MVLVDLATGERLALPAGAVRWEEDGLAASVNLFRTDGEPLTDGDYRLTLDPAGVRDAAGNTLREPGSLDFFVLAGDANRDRQVSLADFLILRANFGQSGKVFSEGDFNYDGQVSLADFLILRGNFGESLPPPPSASPLPWLFAGGSKDEDDGGRNVSLLK